MKKTPLLVIVGIFLLVIVSAFSGYKYWQKTSLEDELSTIDVELANKKKDLLQLENQNVLSAINAKRTVKSLEADSVKWSNVIKTIRSTVPKKGSDFLVDILNYSGSRNSDISMTLKTIPGSDEPYMDVADLLEIFAESRDFKDTFVPSISSGTNDQGEEVLNLTMMTKFNSDPELDLSAESSAEEATEADSDSDSATASEIDSNGITR